MRRILTTFLLLLTVPGSVATAGTVRDLTPEEAYRMVLCRQGDPDFVVLDVRTLEEYREGHLAGALHIDYYGEDFRDLLEPLDRNRTYLIYCRSGGRSSAAYRMMEEMGFGDLYNLSGGITRWEQRGFPVEK